MSTSSNPQKRYVLRYVLRLTEIYGYGGWRPMSSDQTLYLYKSVGRDRQHGYPKYQVTENIENARSWVTRAGAEGYLTAKFNGEGYAVKEVAS